MVMETSIKMFIFLIIIEIKIITIHVEKKNIVVVTQKDNLHE